MTELRSHRKLLHRAIAWPYSKALDRVNSSPSIVIAQLQKTFWCMTASGSESMREGDDGLQQTSFFSVLKTLTYSSLFMRA